MPLDIDQCYSILNTRPGTRLEQIKKSYRQLVRAWHPDLALDPSQRRRCEEKIRQINEAYKTLEALLRLKAATTSDSPSASARQQRPQKSRVVHGSLDPVLVGGKWGYADQKNFLHIPPAYHSAEPFSEGLAVVSVDFSFGYVDPEGRLVVPFRFSWADSFSEGRALVQFGLFGYIDKAGEWVIPPRFQAGQRFVGGIAAVKQGDKWGYVLAGGEWLVLPRFDEAQPFTSHRAFAREGRQAFSVSRDGDVEAL
jgi:hypothetical protein